MSKKEYRELKRPKNTENLVLKMVNSYSGIHQWAIQSKVFSLIVDQSKAY